MELCRGGRGSDGHDEICFEGGNCPLCDMRRELTDEIMDLKSEINQLEKTISKYEEEE